MKQQLKNTEKFKGENPMRNIEIEKIVVHCGGTEDKLEKSVKLLEKIAKTANTENSLNYSSLDTRGTRRSFSEFSVSKISNKPSPLGDGKTQEIFDIKRKIYIKKSTRRIPAFGISPGKKSGAKITFRNKKKIDEMLKKFFAALENRIKEKQITENQLGFGIKEYIEVPGLDYEREIGILGFEVMVVFKRKGKRTKMKKIKQGKYPKKQEVTKEEIIDFLIKNFKMEIE